MRYRRQNSRRKLGPVSGVVGIVVSKQWSPGIGLFGVGAIILGAQLARKYY